MESSSVEQLQAAQGIRSAGKREKHDLGYAWKCIKRDRFYYLMAALPLTWFLIFRYLPMYGIIISFKDYQPWMGVKGILSFDDWVGLKHFKAFLSSVFFWNIMRNTLVISLQRLVWGFPMPIILALLINEIQHRAFKRTVQSISYLPHFFSMVVVAGLLRAMISPNGGLLQEVIMRLGISDQPISFLTDPRYFRSILVGTGIWQGVGWGSIIYLAAIANVNPELYEAAMVDGANKFQRIWYITLPSISYAIAITLIFRIGGLLNAGFGQILLLYSPSVYQVADIIDTYVYRNGLMGMRYSFGAAVGLFKSVIALLLLIISNRVARRVGQPGIW